MERGMEWWRKEVEGKERVGNGRWMGRREEGREGRMGGGREREMEKGEGREEGVDLLTNLFCTQLVPGVSGTRDNQEEKEP